MLETRISYEVAERAARPRSVPQSGRLASLIQRWLDWRARAQQRRHLGALSSHMLKDIGLTQAEIHAEIRKRPWQA